MNTLFSYEVVLKKPLSHTVITLLLSLRTQSIRALQETADFVTFPEKILNEKFHYLCSGVINHVDTNLFNIGKCFKLSVNLIVNYSYCFWGHQALKSYR